MSVMTPSQKKAEVFVEPAMLEDAKRVWNIYSAGRLASQPNAELGVSRGDVWEHLSDPEQGGIYGQIAWWENKIVSGGDQQVLVAVQKSNHNVVGVVWPNVVDGENWLSKLYVARASRGLGVGQKLVEAAQAWHHYQQVKLLVAAYNTSAQRLYKMYGFKKQKEIESGYTIAGKSIPQIEMVYPGVKP